MAWTGGSANGPVYYYRPGPKPAPPAKPAAEAAAPAPKRAPAPDACPDCNGRGHHREVACEGCYGRGTKGGAT